MEDYRENIIPHSHEVTKKNRNIQAKHSSKVIWLTGLSGSGKSTLASGLENFLYTKGYRTYILDGDNIRSGLNSDLDFSPESRKENIRRISEVAKLFVDAGVVVLTAFISPFEEEREAAKNLIGNDSFIEVFVSCPLDVCESRDVKGLYAKARSGEIRNFTGIDSPFEEPLHPDLVLETDKYSNEESLKKLIEHVEPKLVL